MNIKGICKPEVRIWLDGVELFPEKSLKVRNHSPDGFNYGYAGSGPAQLALAIMMEKLPEARAIALYQEFKREVIATLEMDKDFSIEVNFEDWLNQRGIAEKYFQDKIDVVGNNLNGSF